MHKLDPCTAKGALATYDFVKTGGAGDFAWGAADASGSVISSVAEMGRVTQLLLGVESTQILSPAVLSKMQTAQMTTPPSWNRGLGLSGWSGSNSTAGLSLGACCHHLD